MYEDELLKLGYSDEDLVKIEKKMVALVAGGAPIVRKEVSKEEALEIFKNDFYKTELINAIVEEAKVSKKDAEAVLTAFTNAVTKALKADDKVQLVGFGSFEVRKRAERKGRNPQTKAEIVIPASKKPHFNAGKALKDAIK